MKWIVMLALLAASCAGSRDKAVEDAQFLLDQGNYTEAAAAVQPIVAANPKDQQATFILASALLGNGVLGEHGSYLGLLSKLLGDQGSKTGFQTFGRIAPTTAGLPDLQEARDLLINLATFVDADNQKNVYLQLYMARLYEIASVITVTGACSATGYNPQALTSSDQDRFKDNLNNVNDDGQKAGLPTDFGLNDRITTILNNLNLAATFGDFLNSELGTTGNPDLCV